ncbi:amino acid ABC transporter permease [Alkalibacter rhizosphaerae]|uniref:Amino acid ABC transporter permease n=1 Tax=Alkalibacter rhizosphaerae TaxID=2815577 RepID=A0A975AJ41_9FIRM|nr:amino acid ABC transporter permease [Alkalibacter rhizosphaerae]QSX09339.1 amino acid ABC transporter permease [Alkalibacter rhizosphaerae]
MDYLMEMAPLMLQGLRTTLWLFFLTALGSIPLGMLVCILRLSKFKPLQTAMQLYILLMRGTPLLLQLIFIFFGLPVIGIVINREAAALLAFILNYAAYFAEIFRGGILSVSQGQYEASTVLGLSKSQTFFGVILPQVIKRVLPPGGNELITLVKDTSLAYILGLGDVLRASRTLTNQQASLVPLFVAGFIYLLLVGVVTLALKKAEVRFDYYK